MSASAAAPRYAIASTLTAPRLCLLQLLLPDCVRFDYCSPIAFATSLSFAYVSNWHQTALCAKLSAASRLPNRSASTAAPRLRPLQLLLLDCVRFSCCSPIRNCVYFNCSPIVSASTAAPRLRPLRLLLPDCIRL